MDILENQKQTVVGKFESWFAFDKGYLPTTKWLVMPSTGGNTTVKHILN